MSHRTHDAPADRCTPAGGLVRPAGGRVSWAGPLRSVVRWFDAEAAGARVLGAARDENRTDWVRILPFLALHAACLLVVFVGWITSRAHFHTDLAAVKDLARFPALRFLDRFNVLVPTGLALGIYAIGAVLEVYAPHLGTNGPQLFVWGFCISTIVLLHATFTVNSRAHPFGSRRHATRDESRNNPILAAITLGEGWHNNHHHYPASTRQGFYGWEFDVTFYILKLLSWLGIVRDLEPVPVQVRDRRTASRQNERGGKDA